MDLQTEKSNAEDAEGSQRTQSFPESELSRAVIGCAIEVQRHLGTGLLESAYGAALSIELAARQLRFEREVPITANYKGEPLGIAYRADFIVGGKLLIELKARDIITAAHRAQLLSYLRLGGFPIGLLINFHESPLATRGVARVVNQL